MLQWNDLHAYNAVHAVRLPVGLPAARLAAAASQVLERHGLSGLRLDRDTGRYQYAGGQVEVPLKVVPTGGDALAALTREMGVQLNLPFDLSAPMTPFRFFVVGEPEAAVFGVTYFHAVAGAESLVLLMRDIVHAAGATPELGLTPPVDVHPPGRNRWLWAHPGVLLKKLAGLPAAYFEARQCCRPHYRDLASMENGLLQFVLPGEVSRRLATASKAWGVTLNDLFLTLLLKALASLATRRKAEPRRRRLAVGCIVNTRPHLGVDSRRTFGLFLGSFLVTHEVPESQPLRDLALDVHRQTSQVKADRRFMATPVDLGLSRLLLARQSPARRLKFFPKHYPLWGGITNMNLNPLWPQPEGQLGVDYFRAVSSGPVTPLVLSLTTVGDHLNCGLTYRTTVYSDADMATVRRCLVETASQLEVAR